MLQALKFKVCGSSGCSACLDEDCGGPDKVGKQELKYDIDQSRFNIIDPLLHQAFFGSSMLTKAIGSSITEEMFFQVMTSILGTGVFDIIGGIDQVGGSTVTDPELFKGMAQQAFTNDTPAAFMTAGGSADRIRKYKCRRYF